MNPGIVYCSTSGYGQSGPRSQWAGHDLNYLAVGGYLDCSGRNADGAASARVGVDQPHVGPASAEAGKVAPRDAHEDTGGCAGKLARRNRGVLQSIPRDFQKEALLRIQTDGLARRNAEEARIDSIQVAHEAAPT